MPADRSDPLFPAASQAPVWPAALLFCAVALVLRASVFGNPNPMADDAFYFLVGQRMHEGVLPYVDVWDRKPFGLFAIYWAIAGISRSVIAYQLAATLFAALTALVISRLVAAIVGGGVDGGANGRAGLRGGVLAGLAYLLMLGPLDGFSGQTPVFYNLLVATAALRVWRAGSRPPWLAFGLLGLAVTVKQTVAFEAAFLGLWAILRMYRQGSPPGRLARVAAGFVALGLLPTVAIAIAYWQLGHFAEFWHAMVTSNLTKAPLEEWELRRDFRVTAVRMVIPLGLAAYGLLRAERRGGAPDPRMFLAAWNLAAFGGFLSIPHFFPHYALPWLVPLSVAAGLGFARAGGIVAFALVLINAFTWYNPFDRAWNLHAIASTEALASAVVHHDHGRGLFVYDGPVLLYTMTGRPFMSPLVFTHHLNQLIERNVSHLDTDAEVDRVLALHPGVVVTVVRPRNFPVNRHTWDAVQAYIHANCRQVALVRHYDHLTINPTAVWGDCRPAPAAPSHS